MMSEIDIFSAFLKENFNVTVMSSQLDTGGEPELTIEFSQDDSNTINGTLKMIGLDGLKINAETAAKMMGLANTWQVIRDIKIKTINPYVFYIKADHLVMVELIVRRLLLK